MPRFRIFVSNSIVKKNGVETGGDFVRYEDVDAATEAAAVKKAKLERGVFASNIVVLTPEAEQQFLPGEGP